MKKEFGWEETTFAQGQYGGSATKPTTFGGNLRLEVNNRKRMKKAGEGLEVKSSKDLSRWAPGVMAMVAEALTTQVMQRNPMLRPLSWDEHIAHGHTPYRRDCAVCQQAVQQCHPRRKVPYPVAGVLSLDVAGPLIPAKDIGGLYARWMLVGTLTWAVPAESEKMKDPEVPKAEGKMSLTLRYTLKMKKKTMKILRKKVRRRRQVRRKMEKIQWKFGLKKMR